MCENGSAAMVLQIRYLQKRFTVHTCIKLNHYNAVIMSAMASQITSHTIVYSTVYSVADQRKHQNSAPLAFMGGIHRSPAQRASNVENVSIWWRHHVTGQHQRESPHRGPFYKHVLTYIRACISNHTHCFMWNVISHPGLNFNGGLTKHPLKFGHGWVIKSHPFMIT